MVSEETRPDPLDELLEPLRKALEGRLVIGHFGSVKKEGRYHSWWSIRSDEGVERLLSNADYRVAQTLSVLGSEVRLAMLRSLLEGPKTAAEMVSQLGLSTTGQAYHHLRELERAGYVTQRGGRYSMDLALGRVYLTALALAADAGAEDDRRWKSESEEAPPNEPPAEAEPAP
jgi:DNA-binding transcriptional ArsR family regulator